jgi:hypothetical protein
MLHWFIITWHGLYCFTSCFTGSSSLGMVYIVSLDASLVHSYCPLFVFVRIPHWFIITGHGLNCSISFADSSVLSMICIYHFKLRWFIIIEHGSYCFTTRFTGSSLLGMVCIVSLHASLVHSYWALFVFFHFPHLFICTGHGLYYSPHASLVLFVTEHGLYCFTSLTGS